MSQTRWLWGVDKKMKNFRGLGGSNCSSSQQLHERKNLGTLWSARWSFPSIINPVSITVVAVVIAAWLVLAITKVVGVRRQTSPVAKKGSGSNFCKAFGSCMI